MQKVKEVTNKEEPRPTIKKSELSYVELLQLARTHKARGEEKEARQFYALLVQGLRPDNASAELQI